MSTNEADNPYRGPDCPCGGMMWEWLEEGRRFWLCDNCNRELPYNPAQIQEYAPE